MAPRQSTGKVNQIFKGMTFVLFGYLHDTHSYSDIGRWIKAHGGEVKPQVVPGIDYMICTTEDYQNRQQAEPIATARRLPEGIKFVTFDWLENCLMAKRNKGKLLPCKYYHPLKYKSKVQEWQEKKQVVRQRRARDGDIFEALADPYYWHIYTDPTSFEMRVKISKSCPAEKGYNRNSTSIYTWELFLLESVAKPHLYKFGAILHQSDPTRQSAHLDKCYDMEFHNAFKEFKDFFKEMVGVEWELRLKDQEVKGVNCGGGGGGGGEFFRYEKPRMGLPVGVLPLNLIVEGEKGGSGV